MDRLYDPSFLAMLKLSFPQRVEARAVKGDQESFSATRQGGVKGSVGSACCTCEAEVLGDKGGLQELHLENSQFLSVSIKESLSSVDGRQIVGSHAGALLFRRFAGSSRAQGSLDERLRPLIFSHTEFSKLGR